MEQFVMRKDRYHVVREEQYEYYMMPPPQDDHLKITLEQFGKPEEQKAFVGNQKQSFCKGPYLQATVVHQQPPNLMVHKVQTYTIPHHEGLYQQPIPHKEPNNYPRIGIALQGHIQQPNMGNQVPPSSKHGGVMDCNEVAKPYGGRNNKFPLRA